MKPKTISAFNKSQNEEDKKICDRLKRVIDHHLPEAESKIWHAHPVWFLDGNPTVGYSKLKDCIRLMFWSGADFGEVNLKPGTGKFKDASARYTNIDQINADDLERWLGKARMIQWDYRNIQRKGKLSRIS
ncbi:DUF1801 domain-containing protein [Microbulbifer spongiae]|uniref:DUF1801 domain-containing protein n=1 Tax=Microbulbifer spongiae TaxID=2944933 RepID=A0ABY9E9H4_9GAMM|nr:DUF1801 domain-containing protein [Microbulbifer sp. MI-G]WKD49680.1 DUF1801 domain-containing protein [Microbulbifer sp. MI-G]